VLQYKKNVNSYFCTG